jgi:hypothetical protein
MRLLQFINEQDNADSAIESIKKNCSYIIKLYKNREPLLWRGTNKITTGTIIFKKGRTNRKPKDMPTWLHKILNDISKKKIGWPMRDGVSVTPQKQRATAYGNLNIFFPFDVSKWAYVENVRDLFLALDDLFKEISWSSEIPQKEKDVTENMWQAINKIYTEKIVQNKSWKLHNGEVMFNAKNYYLLPMGPNAEYIMKNILL